MITETPNQTRAFLGPESTWGAAQIHLRAVQGLWGGRNVFVAGSGRVVVQRVSEGMFEGRFEFTLTEAETAELLNTFVANDFATLEIPERLGIPDETWIEIALINAAGERLVKAKWEGQEHEQFDNIYRALRALEDRASGLTPVYRGEFDWNFVPEGF